MRKVANALDLVDQILSEAREGVKEAAVKEATGGTCKTTHPVGSADNGTVKPNEGERSKENSAYNKAQHGDLSTHGQVDASSASSAKPSDTIGTEKMQADEVKGNVKEPKSEKDLPDKTNDGPESAGHPSNVHGKYAELSKVGSELAQALSKLAHGAACGENPMPKKLKKVEGTPEAEPAKKDEEADEEGITAEASLKIAAAQAYPDDAAAGWLAGETLVNMISQQKQAEAQVQAAVPAIQGTLENIIKTAQEDAVMFTDYVRGHVDGLRQAGMKAAAIEPPSGGPEAPEAGMSPEDAGPPPGAGDGAGAPPMGPEGGAGGGDEAAVLEELVNALHEAGVTPEELAQAIAEISQEGGHEGAGGEGGEAGGPPGGGDQSPASSDTEVGGKTKKDEVASEKEASAKAKIQQTLSKLTK